MLSAFPSFSSFSSLIRSPYLSLFDTVLAQMAREGGYGWRWLVTVMARFSES